MTPPPPATAVADMGRPSPAIQDSKINRDILNPTRYVSWQWGVLLLLAVLGVVQGVATLAYQTYVGLGVAGYTERVVGWGDMKASQTSVSEPECACAGPRPAGQAQN